MYEELVKMLRKHYDEHCPLDRASGICGGVLTNEAADAIEELTASVECYEDNTDMALIEEDGSTVIRFMPKWIPVTERLPEDGSDVLAYLKASSRVTAANYYKDTWQDCVMGRLYLTEEGFVTHWMPLPEPPEEDKP